MFVYYVVTMVCLALSLIGAIVTVLILCFCYAQDKEPTEEESSPEGEEKLGLVASAA